MIFTAKDGSKSVVSVQHSGLSSRKDLEERKRFWDERLRALAEILAG